MTDERIAPTDQGDSPPPAADGCGCAPPRQPADGARAGTVEATDEPPGAGMAAAGPAAPAPRRSLKLVVTLRPVEGAGYRALLALGADGCDPLLRSAEAGDLQGALDEVPALVVEAEGRWQTHPRNPAARPAPRTRPARPSGPPASLPPAPLEPEAAGPTPDTTGEPAGPGQLSLFG